MSDALALYFELLQVSIGRQTRLSRIPNDNEWNFFLELSQQQTIIGVVFESLEILSKQGVIIPKDIILKWYAFSVQIKEKNIFLNRKCLELYKLFSESGFDSCCIKGQGIADLYSNPLSRQAGDIDIWLNATKQEIISFVKKRYPDVPITSHHIDFPIFESVDVEVHFIPVYTINLRYCRRVNRFINKQRELQFHNKVTLPYTTETVNTPTEDFNIILQLLHIQKHFFYGGVGLRHILDFYFTIVSMHKLDISCLVKEMKKLGLFKLAKAIMWILSDKLNIEEKFLFIQPDEERGRLLLEEIIETGNFGMYDNRSNQYLRKYSNTLSLILRNLKLIKLFPEEAISAPISALVRKL